MWRKQLETFLRPRSCKGGAQSTHLFHVFLWLMCFLTCEQIRVRTGMWGLLKYLKSSVLQLADDPAGNVLNKYDFHSL